MVNLTNWSPVGMVRNMSVDCTSPGLAPARLGRFTIIAGGTVKLVLSRVARHAKPPDTFVFWLVEKARMTASWVAAFPPVQLMVRPGVRSIVAIWLRLVHLTTGGTSMGHEK